jgi:hypothetical protein
MATSKKDRAAQRRQWATNAIVAAMRTTSPVERETLLMIARRHLPISCGRRRPNALA